jgi:hypothetical protein
MPSLLPIFQWFANTWISGVISDSKWLFPAIEGVHIVALALLVGAIFILDLRLLGLVLPTKPLPHLARELAPWILSSLIIILSTGLLLFASEAMKAYTSGPFQVKMILLFTAIVFHFTIFRILTRADDGVFRPLWNKLAATTSLMLWVGVGLAGRAIGFL